MDLVMLASFNSRSLAHRKHLVVQGCKSANRNIGGRKSLHLFHP